MRRSRAAILAIAVSILAPEVALAQVPPAPDARHPDRLALRGGAGTATVVARSGAEVELQLVAASIGGASLGIDPAAPAVPTAAGGLAIVRGGGVIEAYDRETAGVHQTFSIERPARLPARGADLVLVSALAMDGVPASLVALPEGGFGIARGGAAPAFSYSAPVVFDARGATIPARAQALEAGRFAIVVEGGALAEAAWPILVDPFIDLLTEVSLSSGAATGDDATRPDCAYDGIAFDAHLVAWHVTRGTNEEIAYQIVTPNRGVRMPSLAQDGVALSSAAAKSAPRVAFLEAPTAADSRYAIVTRVVNANGDGDIVLVFVAPDGALGASVTVDGTAADDSNPVIAADPETDQLLVVWERAGATSTIVGRAVNLAGALGPIFTVGTSGVIPGGTSPSSHARPALAARPVQSATADAWAIVYEDDANFLSGGGQRQLVGCFVPVVAHGAAPVAVAHVALPTNIWFLADKDADIAAAPEAVGAVALVAWAVDLDPIFGNGFPDHNVQVCTLKWDGLNQQSFIGVEPITGNPLLIAGTGDDERNPAVFQRFFGPGAGGLPSDEPPFMVAYDRDAGNAAWIAVAEIVLESQDPIFGNRIFVSSNKGTPRFVRGQFTSQSPEELLLVRQARFPSGTTDNILAEKRAIAPAGTIGNQAVTGQETFDAPSASFIPWPGIYGLPWTAGFTPSNPWVITAGEGVGGTAGAVASGPANSDLEVTLDITGSGFVAFQRKVDLPDQSDQLEFKIDGKTVGVWRGERSYAQEAFFVPAAGPRTVKLTWHLDHNSSQPGTAAIDDIAFPPVAAPVISSFTATPSSVNPGQPVTFQALVSGIVLRFVWNFGDGNVVTTPGDSVTHAYTQAGTYTASLRVEGPNATGVPTNTVTVFVRPSITPTPTQPGGGGGGGGGGCALGVAGGGPGMMLPLVALAGALLAVRRRRTR